MEYNQRTWPEGEYEGRRDEGTNRPHECTTTRPIFFPSDTLPKLARNLITLQYIRDPVKNVFAIISFLLVSACTYGQMDTTRHVRDTLNVTDTLPGRVYVLQNVKRDGLTLPEVEIKEVTIVAQQKKSSPRRTRVQLRQYDRLIYNLKKTYPYAVIAREKLAEVNSQLEAVTDEKERRELLKTVEKEILGEFEDDARNMTITQGRLLIKLIDRETQNTSFELIKQYRGFLSAAFWQGIARIFGSNLKAEYDPFGEDALIELIVRDIEMGWL
jgi:hypothetical protein